MRKSSGGMADSGYLRGWIRTYCLRRYLVVTAGTIRFAGNAIMERVP
jgi:hypothetical protein